MMLWIIAAAVIIGIAAAFSGSIQKKPANGYSASFLEEDELVSSSNHGYCINGLKCLSIEDSFKHMMVTGGSGNFKSSGILIPSILRMRKYASFVVNDPAGELLYRTGTALERAGYTVKVLNYNKPSEGFNPLSRVQSASDIKKIAKLLISTSLGSGGKDPFWNNAAENLCSLAIQYTLKYTDEQYHTLANVYEIISLMLHSPQKADKLFVKADQRLLNEYKTFISYGDKTMASIVATSRTAIAMFATDENVALVTSYDSIDFEAFRKERTALFINNSVTTMRYHAVTTSIFLDQFFESIMRQMPSKKDLPIFFLLDEASSLTFNNLQITIANLRKFRSSILQAYQSVSQLVDLYTQPVARAIMENCATRVYMPGQPITVAIDLESQLGKIEFLDDRGIKHIRPLLAANQIRELEEVLVFHGNKKAIKTPVTPYFKQWGLNWLANLPPYQPANKIPFNTPPIIPFA
jgi:type IV secretion system protein VirD4